MIALSVAIACFLPPFIGSATGLIAADIFKGLGFESSLGSGLFSWLFTVYTLTSTIFLIPAARLADKISRKGFFLAGVLILGCSSIWVGLSSNMTIVLIARGVQGLGNALMFGTAISLVSAAVHTKMRGTAISIAMTGVFLGQLAAPLVSGALTNALSWRAVYFILLPISLISFVIALIFIPKDKPIDTGKFDWLGTIIFIVGIAFAVYGFSELPDMLAIRSIIIGSILLTFFSLYEKRNSNPLIPINLILHNREFSFNNGANLLYYVAIYATGPLISIYMTELWGIIDPFLRALIITTEGLILFFFTYIAGKFYDHMLPKFILILGGGMTVIGIVGAILMGGQRADVGWLTNAIVLASVAAFGIGSIILGIIDRRVKMVSPRVPTCLGLFIIILGMVIFLTSSDAINLWLLIITEALFGIGIAIFVTPNSTAIMDAVSEKEYNMASGTLSTVRMLGMTLSFGIVSILETIFITNDDLYASEFLTMLHDTIIISISVLVIAIILSWFGGKARHPE
ncbi:MAG TPA: MFS transporter [Methanocorpusculum sp.]|nr:MFS transporter [Methanocorpusculum sp.]